MSLRVWLPLDGSLENRGISDIEIINNGATVDNNGKIGKCYNFGNNKYLKIENYATEFLTYNEFSLSVWFKCTAQNTAHGGSALISSGNWNQPANLLNLALGYFGSDHYTRLLVSGSGVWSEGYSYNFYLNQWYNVVLTSGNGAVRAYVNGELIGDSYAAFKPASLEQTWICVGNGTYVQVFPFYGLMNDVRIYDHCLSQKEVKEISQGLILHYKLDGLSTGLNNLAQTGSISVYNNYSGSGTTGTLTKLNENFNGAPVYRLVMTPNDTSLSNIKTTKASHGVYGFRQTFKANTKYCFWIYYRPISHLDVRVGGTASNIAGWTEIAPKQVSNEWYIVGQFRNGSVTEDKTDNIFTSFYTPTAASGQPITIDFVSPFLIEGNTNIDEGAYWGLNGINKIPDSSGFGNDGTITGELTTDNNGTDGRYNISTYFSSGNTNYITTPTLTLPGDAITMNFWFKSSNKTPGADYHMPLNSNQAYEMSIHKNGYLRGGLVIDGTRRVDNCTSTKLLDGNWHMCTMTYDGATIKRYVDAVMEKSTTATGALATSTYFVLGHYGTNLSYYNKEVYESDVRIYATALSAEDVAILYHALAQVDDLQNIHAFEFKENDNRTSVYQNGIMSAIDEIYESNSILLNTETSGGYTPAKNTNNSCTHFGYVDFEDYFLPNQDLSVHIECDVDWTAFTADTGGTFRGVWFQGANYEISSSTYKWAGTNYITGALNSSYSLQNTTLLSTNGNHHYDVITTIPSSWFSTYSRSDVGFRCNYSDGTGTINIKNFKVTPLKYYNAKVGEDFISANNFIEK